MTASHFSGCPSLQLGADDLERAEDLPHQQAAPVRPLAAEGHRRRQGTPREVRHRARRGQAVQAGQRKRHNTFPGLQHLIQ